MNNSFIL